LYRQIRRELEHSQASVRAIWLPMPILSGVRASGYDQGMTSTSTLSVTSPATADSAIRFQTEPMMEQHSHIFGKMQLFAPDAPFDQWDKLPWRLKSEKAEKGAKPLDLMIRPERVQECWKHSSIIREQDLWPQAQDAQGDTPQTPPRS
jgi:hypothetical protein